MNGTEKSFSVIRGTSGANGIDSIDSGIYPGVPLQSNRRSIGGGRSLSRILEYYVCGEIEEASKYIDWFDEIRHADKSDIIKIYINSPGGDLFTAIQFMRILRETNAHVIASVEGACMSAATLIFLSAVEFEISQHSNFMFHNYSGRTYGKGGEMMDQLLYERKWSETLLYDAYANFLTNREIKSILANKDIWLNSEQVVQRLNKRSETRDAATAEVAKHAIKESKVINTPAEKEVEKI